MINNVKEVTGGSGGEAYLVPGSEKVALIDCGMAYCAPELISNIKQQLGSRKLDLVFLSHSHYDHIGAIPYLRVEWPSVEVLGAEHAMDVLCRNNALRTIRELSIMAGRYYGAAVDVDYDDSLMKVDRAVHDGDTFDLGGASVRVLEPPGHTKWSLTFMINDEVMLASETSGVISPEGRVYPAFINSYEETLSSIDKCSRENPRFIISPHNGIVSESERPTYWQKCRRAAEECREFVLRLLSKGYDVDSVFEQYRREYQDEDTKEVQPGFAFEINSRAMIKTIIRGK